MEIIHPTKYKAKNDYQLHNCENIIKLNKTLAEAFYSFPFG